MATFTRRGAIAIMSSAAALTLAGCSTFRPAYGPGSEMGLAFIVDEPKTPLERIAWREFLLRFEGTQRADSPRLSYSVRTYGLQRQLARPGGGPTEVRNVRAEIRARITFNGETLLEVTRFADAGMTLGRGSTPDYFAREGAEERAVEAAAESIRIAIIAEFPKHEREWSRAEK